MKKILISALFLMSSILISQGVDETYLNSLPEGVRKDVMERIENKEESEKPVYRSASSSIDKDDRGKSGIFGEKFFDTIQTSFMPINEPNFDGSYILDFGDVIEIQLIGQDNTTDAYSIKRDGSINVPDIGKIFLSGLTLNEASSFIKSKINITYIGTEAFVSLINIRDINILIAGNAFNPGIYTLNGNSNMLHALSMAGGIDSIGSYRNINLIRNGKVIDSLDIYDVLIYGKSNFTKSLRSGDSILVNPVSKIVAIESGVLRPGLYELKDSETFSDLIRFANGLNANANESNILLKRTFKGVSEVIEIDLSKADSYEVKRGDSLFIREYKLNSVNITGAVKNPGTYKLPMGTTLSKLIEFTGGYEDSAYPFGGFLVNQKALEINQNAKEKLYNKFLNNLIEKSQSSAEDSGLGLVLQQLQDAPVTGRVMAEFDLDVIKTNPNLDTILEQGDEILIPNITQQVYVQGEVSNQGAIRYLPGQSLDYYIENSGGILTSADAQTIFVVHPNGETQNISVNTNSRLSFILNKNNSILIYPGSIIYVPKSADITSGAEIASIWAPIISSVALSLTSLSVLSNNN
jgi:protein involved in polysaccharide export with SLBB domain